MANKKNKGEKVMEQKLVSGYFLDEDKLITAIKNLQGKDIVIQDVYTPFPVHGLENVLGYRKSQIPTVGFIFGALGATLAFLFQAWVFTKSYPMNIGGKPLLSVPTFIPVVFETTVLFAATSMVFAFLFRSKLGLGAKHKVYDPKVTDDRFLILLAEQDKASTAQLMGVLKEAGAKGVQEIIENEE